MPLGNYNANIVILSDAGDMNIPVVLEVSNTAGLLGDLNNDSILNVLDIVVLVSIIVNQSDYMYNGDLNQDSVIDVLDIVLLVGQVLGT
jgi:hypothetical protein